MNPMHAMWYLIWQINPRFPKLRNAKPHGVCTNFLNGVYKNGILFAVIIVAIRKIKNKKPTWIIENKFTISQK